MAVIFVDKEDNYEIRTKTREIAVQVIIGDGQSGSYTISLDDKTLDFNKSVILGVKAEVQGKDTIVIAKVTATLKETKNTSITVIVTEGASTTTFGPYTQAVEKKLDSVMYTLTISNK